MRVNDYNAAQRHCDGCTACCGGWLNTNVDGFELKPGTPCKHLGETGCTIYNVRPKDPCALFACGWLLDQTMPDWLRPDRSKVIIKPNFVWERVTDTINVHVATAAAPRIPGKTKRFLREFALKNRCNFLCTEPVKRDREYVGEKRVLGLGTPEFEAEVEAWQNAGHPFYIKDSESNLLVGGRMLLR